MEKPRYCKNLAWRLFSAQSSGAWYSYKGERIGQGKDNTREFLKGRKDLADEIEAQIRAKLLPVKPRVELQEKSA